MIVYYNNETLKKEEYSSICYSDFAWNSPTRHLASTGELWCLFSKNDMFLIGQRLLLERLEFDKESPDYFTKWSDVPRPAGEMDILNDPYLIKKYFDDVTWSHFMIENLCSIWHFCSQSHKEKYSFISFNRLDKRDDAFYVVFDSVKHNI